MKSKVIAILESRTGQHLGELVERRGAVALLAPALEEVPDVNEADLAALLQEWRAKPFDIVIFQTGVGTKALFQATDALGSTGDVLAWLAQARVIVRGPKPVGELNSRTVRIDIRASSPFTSETVLAALQPVEIGGTRVLVQRYGAANQLLRAGLEERGASVHEVATYKWAVPRDTRPLEGLLDALAAQRVHAVVFTSAVQIRNLHTVAERSGRAESLAALLNKTIIASIGPVCSRTLREYGVTPTLEADPPKLGPLVTALDAALSD
jgi:uroporphyrinogen-III synthase